MKKCTKNIIKLLCSTLYFAAFFVSCAKKQSSQYDQIISSKLTGQDLLQELVSFELNNTSHFSSKLDLANYYMLVGDYQKAEDYLIRAESVKKNAPSGKEGKKQLAIMYGFRAQIDFYKESFKSAEKYIQKSIKADSAIGEKYKYLSAQILMKKNQMDDALALFDETYAKLPDEITPEDEKAYMLLLNSKDRNEDCKVILEKFFEDGSYYPGLGMFASTVYEKNHDFGKSILSAYLDLEYNGCFNEFNNVAMTASLDSISEALKQKYPDADPDYVIYVLKTRYLSFKPSFSKQIDFFPFKYIELQNKIDEEKFTSNDITDFIALEKYFNLYPSYYWYSWKGFKQVSSTNDTEYIPLLEKIILLGRGNIYIDKARKELGRMKGLSENLSESILLPEEIVQYLDLFGQTGEESFLEPLFTLLSLPENEYEISCMAILKSSLNIPGLLKVVNAKRDNSTGRLFERLDFILR